MHKFSHPRSSISTLAQLCSGAALLLSGCASPPAQFENVRIPTPPPPVQSGPNAQILEALTCMRTSGALSKLRFAVAVHADGTGKSSAGYEGATGAFLPQGTTAMWAAQAVMYAGATAQNYYELNTERALRQFGGADAERSLTEQQKAQPPHFVLSTAFLALDFLGGTTSDVRIGGIGPGFDRRGASLEVAAEIYRPGDRTTLALSSVSRQVFYTASSLGVSRIVGGGAGEIITGTIGRSDQQRLQEASREAIMLSVADVLSGVPTVPESCRQMIAHLKIAPPAPIQPLDELLAARKGSRGAVGAQTRTAPAPAPPSASRPTTIGAAGPPPTPVAPPPRTVVSEIRTAPTVQTARGAPDGRPPGSISEMLASNAGTK